MGYIDTITTKKVIDPDGTQHYLTVQPWDTWIQYQMWIFDSYPHDERWEAARESLAYYEHGFATIHGGAVP